MADLTDAEKAAAEKIVMSWNWQMSEARNYRFKHGVHALTRFYESAPMESDEFKLILKYLSTQEDIKVINVNQKAIELEGEWKAKDAWYQTVDGDKFEGSEANRVRIYQTIIGKEDEGTVDGPYMVENGCKYKISHTFLWDVDELPDLESEEYKSKSGVQYTLQGVTRDKETGQWSCVIECRETVQQDIELYESGMTIYEKIEKEGHWGVRQENLENTGLKASVGDGVLVERELSKNPDCTTDVTNRVTTEKGVEESLKGWRKTIRGTVETIKDRNQQQPLDGEGLKVGESRQSEKTPGGLYDNTITMVNDEAGGLISEECGKTIFEHSHTETENVLEKPVEEHVDDAAGGVIHRRGLRETEEGTWDVTEHETTELPVSDAAKAYRKTLRGTVVTTTDRNQTNPLGSSDMKVGETRQSEKTPGGLYNNTRSAVTTDAAGKISQSCENTELEHTDATVENEISEPEQIEQTAEQNKIKSLVARQTEDGTWDVQRTTRTYNPKSTIETWHDENYEHILFVYSNYTEPVTPSSGAILTASDGTAKTIPLDGAIIQSQYSQTQYGSYNGSVHVNYYRSQGSRIQTLYWEKTYDVKSKYYYFNKKGELCSREFSAKCSKYYGPYRTVLENCKDGDNLSHCGWITGVHMVGVDNAMGTKYKSISCGAEVKVDQGAGSGSSAAS